MTTGAIRVSCVLFGIGLVLASERPASAAQSAPSNAALHLVVPFENTTGEPRVYWLSEASAVLLTDDLGALGPPSIGREDRLRAFERLRVPSVTSLSHATVIRLGEVVGAAYVVVGQFELEGEDQIGIIVLSKTGQWSCASLSDGFRTAVRTPARDELVDPQRVLGLK